MIILHLSLVADELLLWGEVPIGTPRGRRAPARRGDPNGSRSRPVARAPNDAGPDVLDGAAVALFGADRAGPPASRAWAWLPTRGNKPITTSRLAPLDASRPRGRTHITPWVVSCLPITGPELLKLGMRCAGTHALGDGIVVGPDLAYWSDVLAFACALVVRQHARPSLAEDGLRARWQAVLLGDDEPRADTCARSMPSVARALTMPAHASPPVEHPRAVLDRFLDIAVDALMRLDPDEPSVSEHTSNDQPVASVHDMWTNALIGPDAALRDAAGRAADADTVQLDLAEPLARWTRPLLAATTAPFRLAFRLEDPVIGPEDEPLVSAEAERAWLLTSHLQSRSDASLSVAVDALHSPDDEHAVPDPELLALLDRHGYDEVQHLLEPLGQAATLSTVVANGLAAGVLGSCLLDDVQAHDFVAREAIGLERAGFGLQLPAWLTRGRARSKLALRAKVSAPRSTGGAAGLTLDRIVQVQWSVALGDETLTRNELEALARAKVPLVRVRGEWVQVDADQLQAVLARATSALDETMSLRALVRMSLTGQDAAAASAGNGAPAARVEVAGVDATGWVADVLARLSGTASFAELKSPPSLVGTLRPYQLRGYSWLTFLRELGLGACLADDMGLGKTVQMLAAIAHEREAVPTGKKQRPVLLVCPTSVVGNWQREAARFVPELPVLVHHGPERLEGRAFARAARAAGLVVTTYALLHRDQQRLESIAWNGVVLDEAQNVKNAETRQAKAARSLTASWRVALTGTPVENHVGDLWSIMEFLNPGLLGTRTSFRREYLLPIETGSDADAAERLRRVTGPFVLRRLKSDRSIIRDLPGKNEMRVGCSLTAEQATLYQAVLEDFQQRIDEADSGIERKGLVLALMTKLKQACNHPAQLLGDGSGLGGRSGKLERLVAMLDEVRQSGERALVFTQYTAMAALLRRHVEDVFGDEVAYLHGGTTKLARDRLVEQFQAEDGPGVFVLSLKAGGTGLNLTAASHVFHYDRWWNPAVEDQATDRAYRIGQRRSVSVHKFVCLGTFEERIDEMIRRKQSIAGAVVGSGEKWLTELSNTQLRDLFALHAPGEVVA